MSKVSYLDFEQGIAELEKRIDALQVSHDDHDHLDISKELDQLQKKNKKMLEDTYKNLSAWQISQVARHPQRPYTLDYIRELFTDFEELHGDRAFADDPAIVGGLARFDGAPVMVIGHQKGRDVKERQYRNFGMPCGISVRLCGNLLGAAYQSYGIDALSHRDPFDGQ